MSAHGHQAAMAEATVSLELLGGFGLSHEHGALSVPLTVQRVLAFLALQRRPVRRLHVAGTLWPGSSETRASASLRTVVWRLRSLDPAPLYVSGSQLGLGTDVVVDALQILDDARTILGGDPVSRDVLERLVSARDLLPDWYDDWVLIEREQLREQRVRALEHLCDTLTCRGCFADAARAGLAAVACEPLRESPQRVLIPLHLAEGNESAAVRRYSHYRTMLERKLGLVPSARMNELLGELRYSDRPAQALRAH